MHLLAVDRTMGKHTSCTRAGSQAHLFHVCRPVPGRHRPSARPPTMNSPSKGRPSAHYTPPAMSHPSPPSINLPIDDEDDYDEESAYPTQPPHGPSAYYSTALTAPGSGPSPMYQDDEEMYFESSLKRRMDQEEACPLLSEQRCLVTSDSGEAFECVDVGPSFLS